MIGAFFINNQTAVMVIINHDVMQTTIWSKMTRLNTHLKTPIKWPFVRDYLGEPVPEGKTNLDLLEQETVSGISWAICESAPRQDR